MNRPTPEQPFHRCLTAFLVVLSLVPSPLLLANPAGEVVIHGDVQFDRSESHLRVLQASDRAIIDWESFSIGAGQLTEFVQPNSSSAALNRVRGASASQIEGMLRANGKVYILNPNGILIGPNGSIDVGGFAGSTLDVSDEQFRNGGDLNFAGASQAAIVNLGSISALDGDVILIAASVSNEGIIRAPRGTAALAAGNDVLLAESGSERVFVRGAKGGNKAVGVNNSGAIEANIAELKSYGGNIYGMAVKNEGRVAATGVTRSGGQIFLSAKGGKIRSTGTLKARKSDGSGGRVKVDSGTDGRTEIGGKIDASGDVGKGGEIVILGREIEVFEGSLILNDGETGGGNTFVGGGLRGQDPEFGNAEFVTVGEGGVFSANALELGNGGQVIVFAEDTLILRGNVSAKGGAENGNGGFVELSGKNEFYLRSLTSQVDLSAESGHGGTLLLDPTNINVVHALSATAPILGPQLTANSITDFDINTFLVGNSLEITTNSGALEDGNITINSGVEITWGSAHNLTFIADNNFTMDPTATISASGAGSFSVTAARSITIGANASITTANGDLSLTANEFGTTVGNFTGIHVNGGTVESLGTGSVTLTGQGGNSGSSNDGIRINNGGVVAGGLGDPLTLNGTGGVSGGNTNRGVAVVGGTITSLGSDVEIEGTGGGTGGSSENSGVFLSNGLIAAGTGGKLDIVGVGGGGEGNNHKGVWVSGASNPATISTSGGDLFIQGTGGGTGPSFNNQGIDLAGAAVVVSATNGQVSLIGTGGIGMTTEGIRISGTLSGETGIEIVADRIAISTGPINSINSGTATTTIRPLSGNFAIGLGADDDTGILGLTDAELDRITAGTLQIGNSNSGAITVSAAISPANVTTLSLTTGAAINGTGSLAVSKLALFSATGIGTSTNALNTQASFLEADGGTGGIFAANTGDITVGGVTSLLDGLAATNGNIKLTAASSITVNEAINGGSGTIALSASEDVTISADVSATGNGAIDIDAGRSISSNAVLSVVNGDLTMDANPGGTTSGDFHGIHLVGGSLSTSGDGNITLTATSGDANQNTGILVSSGSTISSTGTAAGSGTITLTGSGNSGSSDTSPRRGLQISGTVEVAGGALTITGTGADNSDSDGGNLGIWVTASGLIRSTAGKITLQGTGRGGGVTNYGVLISGGGKVTATHAAEIEIVGQGSTSVSTSSFSPSHNIGFRMAGDGSAVTGETGSLSITGTGGSGISENLGIQFIGESSIATTTGAITLTGHSPNGNFDGIRVAAGARVGGTGTTGPVTLISSDDIHLGSFGTAGHVETGSGLPGGAITLRSDASIILRGGSTITSQNQDIVLNSDSDATGGGNIQLTNTTINSNGGAITLGGGVDPLNPAAAMGSGTGSVEEKVGIFLSNSALNSGIGNISLRGQGIAGTSNSYGIHIEGGSVIGSNTGTGTITLHGTGGAGTSNGWGVNLIGTNTAVRSQSGNISITGQGGAGTGTHQFGTMLWQGARVESAGSATVTLSGTAGNGSSTNYGFYMDGATTAVTSAGGAISITGQGGGSGTDNRGIFIDTSAKVLGTGSATVTLNGTGGNGTTGNYGVYLTSSGAEVRVENGALSITGQGAGSVSSNHGVFVSLGAAVLSTGTGSISLTGTGSSAAGDNGILLSSGTSVSSTGTGAITLTTARNILLDSGSSISTASGSLTLSANELTSTAGSFEGILIDAGASLSTTAGDISLFGRGGENNSTAGNHGIRVVNTASITSGGGDIFLTGFAGGGGTGTGWTQEGVTVTGEISTTGTGNITIAGTGGNGSEGNLGTQIFGGALVSTENGDISITGTSGAGSNSDGVRVAKYGVDPPGVITTLGGSISLTGDGSAGLGSGINTFGSGVMIGGATTGNISINADTMNLGAAVESSGVVTLAPLLPGYAINLGGNDVAGTTLGLTDAELDLITAGTLQIGNSDSGAITVSSAISHGNHLSLTSVAGVSGSESITLNGAKNFSVTAGGEINLTGVITVPGTTSFNTGAFGITVNNALNNFGGAVSFANSGVNAVQVRDANSLVLGSVVVGGNLSLTTAGSITQTGVITSGGTTTLNAGSANDITLTNASNNFSSVAIGSGRNVALRDFNSITLNASTVSGTFGITATGITVAGALGLGGDADFDSSAGITFSHSVTMAADKSLDATASGLIDLSHANADLSTSGTGAISLTTTRNINLSTGSSLVVENRNLTLSANANGTESGNFSGITVGNGSLIESTGTGTVNLTGKGGVAPTGNDLRGVEIAGTIRSASGAIEVSGSGGGGTTGERHNGIRLESTGLIQSTGTGSGAATITLTGLAGSGAMNEQGIAVLGAISSIDGDITLTGTGGSSAGNNNKGIHLFGSGSITSTGINANAADITLTGYGSNSQAGLFSEGIGLPGGSITSIDGDITLTGRSYVGDNVGIRTGTPNNTTTTIESTGSGAIAITAIGSPLSTNDDFFSQGSSTLVSSIGSANGTGGITLNADTADLTFVTLRNSGDLRIRPEGFGVSMELGGETGILNLNVIELANLADGFNSIQFGNELTGQIRISTSTFNDTVDFISGEDIEVVGEVTGDEEMTFTANNITVTAPITTASGALTFNLNDQGPLNSGTISVQGELNGFAGVAFNGGNGTADTVTYSAFAGTVEVAVGQLSGIEILIGNGSNSTFTGLNGDTDYTITGQNDFTFGSFTVTDFANLIGGSGDDNFRFRTAGVFTGTLNGGGGSNTIDFAFEDFGAPASIDFQTKNGSGFSGGGSFANIAHFIGQGADYTFTGLNGDTDYTITGQNDFTFGSFTVTDFANLTGGSGADTFDFGSLSSLQGLDGIVNGGAGNDIFNFRNQATVSSVNGGVGDYDTLFLDDSNLPGDHTYTITSNTITRNPVYHFINIEHLHLLAGDGDDTINSGFFPFSQTLDAGPGFNTLNLPGVTNLDGTTQIQNVSHLRFAAPRTLQSVPGNGNTPPPPAEFIAQNRFNSGNSDRMMEALMGNQGGFSATTIIGQGVIIAVEGNSYLIFRAISLDGSGLTPSDAAAAALSENLSVDANVELAGAIGYTGIVLLFMRDGAYALDLSGAVIDPAVLSLLQSNLGTAAAIELFAALEIPFMIVIIDADGAITIDFDGTAPGQPVIVVLAEQLSDAAFDELNAALAEGN